MSTWKFSKCASLVLSALLLVACGEEHSAKKSDAAVIDDSSPEGQESSEESSEADATTSAEEAQPDAASTSQSDAGDASASADPTDIGASPVDAGGGASDTASADAAVACPDGCDDKVDCTVDTCVRGTCIHAIDAALCKNGASCDAQKGCSLGKTCATAQDCADTDGCTINERCDPASARCLWDPLDRDGDKQAALACGGADCNDANRRISPSATESCDGADNDCDGTIDDGALCPGGAVCKAGACVCDTGDTQCGGACADLKTDAAHCGRCDVSCGAGTCTDGACSCGAPSIICARTCVDPKTSMANCGGCGNACQPITQAGQPQICLAGACSACGAEGQACCGALGCLNGFSCSGEPTTAGSTCVCPPDHTKCGAACADLKSDEQHCGMCGMACGAAQVCVTANDASACVACGGEGEPCCEIAGLSMLGGICGRGLTCGDNDVCTR
ncbi:MAG: hypothetical protein RL385_1689 [Pseudomonadota bacterium]|jgi:hypothetical protein